MLDGAAKISELVAEVANQNMPAIAMTDHGNVFGAFEFHKLNQSLALKHTLHPNPDLINAELSGQRAVRMMFLVAVLTLT
jgi:DNA polymerase III alpha subunit